MHNQNMSKHKLKINFLKNTRGRKADGGVEASEDAEARGEDASIFDGEQWRYGIRGKQSFTRSFTSSCALSHATPNLMVSCDKFYAKSHCVAAA